MKYLAPIKTVAMAYSMSVDEVLDIAKSNGASLFCVEGMIWANPEEFEYLNQAEDIFMLSVARSSASDLRCSSGG